MEATYDTNTKLLKWWGWKMDNDTAVLYILLEVQNRAPIITLKDTKIIDSDLSTTWLFI